MAQSLKRVSRGVPLLRLRSKSRNVVIPFFLLLFGDGLNCVVVGRAKVCKVSSEIMGTIPEGPRPAPGR